jgi:predicted RNase H-like nuclease (RuvC/YqgF family)
LVSLFHYLLFFIYKIYFLNSFREKEGKIIPKLTTDIDRIREMENEKKSKEIKEEILLLKRKINELQSTIKKLESEVYNLYNLIEY